ncbi:MAG TPA: AAA family ATPase [Vicinamibacterales bacterium]|nr:AAA family ATPase [Vicinamibacterales bacterium]HPK70826.1 AAA family ATPase [Vicinamibacterales bacterium]
MYEAFFGLNERPFQLTPNPRFLFLNPRQREALATLRYGFTSSLGITLLLGEAGTGKTTLLRAALDAESRPEYRHVVLNNPTLSPGEFYEILADRFALPAASGSKAKFLLAFERDLAARHAAGGLTAIVIDEAQSLTHELFEEVRLLANLETATAKLVNVVLVGQPELADRLNDPSLRQLKQRVVLRCSLEPLDRHWTACYIASRLRVAGGEPTEVFAKDAVLAIYEASRGIPRTIGVVCENALLAGYAAQKKPVDGPLVAEVCGDLDLASSNGRPRRAGEPLIEPPADENGGADERAARPRAALRAAAQARTRRREPGAWLPPKDAAAPPDGPGRAQDAPANPDPNRIFRFF